MVKESGVGFGVGSRGRWAVRGSRKLIVVVRLKGNAQCGKLSDVIVPSVPLGEVKFRASPALL